MTHRPLTIFLLALFLTLASAPLALASSPALSLIMPRGVQRGVETEIVFLGARLADAQEILFYEPGIEVLSLEAIANDQVKVQVKIATDVRLGQHIARVRCASGITELRTFYVGALPGVDEVEPNDEFQAPQKIAHGVTVAGVIENEDVDYFQIDAKQGEVITVEVEGMRLGATIFDPYVAILDAKRFELVAADDSPLSKQDPIASLVIPEDGSYIVMLRESAYGGNGNCRYRMHVGSFPRPTAIYPPGGKLGEEIQVEFLGDAGGVMQQTIKLPDEQDEDFALFAQTEAGISPSGIPFRLSTAMNVLEVEPNNNRNEATPGNVSSAFNGIIGDDGDFDWFRFSAKKGQAFDVHCLARRLGSPLDSVMSVHSADGKQIATNDDQNGIAPDSYFRFNVPEDGEYLIRVFDQLRRGGDDFVYRVELTPVQPSLTLSIPQVARYSQDRQTIAVPRGNRFATLMLASRGNFRGPLVFDAGDLPEGVTMHAVPMPGNTNLSAIVFEAAEDAPIAGKLVDFQARHAEKESITGRFSQRAQMLMGAPGQSEYWIASVNRLAVAVVDKLPFSIELVAPKVSLVRNGSMQLKVIVHREEGFKGAVNVQFPFRPPGVGATASINIPANKTEGLYPISANGNAAVQEWNVVALASSNVNGAAWVSSPLVKLRITDADSQVELSRTTVEQGQKTQILAKFTHGSEFADSGKVRLMGLPNSVAAPEVTFDKETQEAVFEVTTDAGSPAGTHKNIFAQIEFVREGERMIHRSGATELRIDPPPAEKKKANTPPPTKAQKNAQEAKPSKKPLTRLEKLRQEAKQRGDQKQKGQDKKGDQQSNKKQAGMLQS
ncbi:MAG: PPC domain-containing protein [Pirellulales bacterium]|nr:PPC domain-containing protein [Pirellulales bacterium]